MLTCLQVHNDYLIPGGETKSAKLIADLLEKNGIRVVHYYVSNEDLKVDGAFSKIKSAMQSIYNRLTVREIQKIIDTEHIDFALIHNTSPIISNSVYSVLKRNGIRTIKYLQNYNMLCLNGALDHGEMCKKCQRNSLVGVKAKCYKGSRLYSLQKSVSKLLLRKKYVNAITDYIALSKYVKEKHAENGINNERIHVIYHFCENDPCKIATTNSDYIVYMGRLSKEKGILTLIKAVSHVPEIQLKIMGKGDLEEEISEYLSSNNITNVELIGYKTGREKDAVVGNAMALIAPSEWEEPFGRIAIEAYQVGTPVIASRTGGLQELIVVNETGYLFEAGNVDELEDQLKKIASLNEDELTKMRNACVELVMKRFSKETYMSSFMRLLEG